MPHDFNYNHQNESSRKQKPYSAREELIACLVSLFIILGLVAAIAGLSALAGAIF